jgi:hypothetical protein
MQRKGAHAQQWHAAPYTAASLTEGAAAITCGIAGQ